MDGVFCFREIASTVPNPVRDDKSAEQRNPIPLNPVSGWQAGNYRSSVVGRRMSLASAFRK